MPILYDSLHRHGFLEFWSSHVDGGVDEFDVFDALTEHDLYSFGFREVHLVKWLRLKQSVAVLCRNKDALSSARAQEDCVAGQRAVQEKLATIRTQYIPRCPPGSDIQSEWQAQ